MLPTCYEFHCLRVVYRSTPVIKLAKRQMYVTFVNLLHFSVIRFYSFIFLSRRRVRNLMMCFASYPAVKINCITRTPRHVHIHWCTCRPMTVMHVYRYKHQATSPPLHTSISDMVRWAVVIGLSIQAMVRNYYSSHVPRLRL